MIQVSDRDVVVTHGDQSSQHRRFVLRIVAACVCLMVVLRRAVLCAAVLLPSLLAAVVLGTMPWSLGVAVSGQLCRLVLRNAGCLMDLSAATLLGPHTWSKLTHLEVHGAEVRARAHVQGRGREPHAAVHVFRRSYAAVPEGIAPAAMLQEQLQLLVHTRS